jgi:hypothetical protein
MSDLPVRQKKSNTGPSDLSQVLAHGPAVSTAYGKRLGFMLMMFALMKTRTGMTRIIAALSAAYLLLTRLWS